MKASRTQASSPDEREIDTDLLALFSDGWQLMINPDLGQIRSALSKVQARTRVNKLTAQEAVAVYRRVAQEGEYIACAGVKDCPYSFSFGIRSTVIQVARLTDSIIACAIGRPEVLPGDKGVPPVSADPFEHPQAWFKQVVEAFWLKLDDQHIALIERQALAAAMALEAREARNQVSFRSVHRTGIKRQLQLKALFKQTEPVYVSELTDALKRIGDELQGTGESQISWRVFQLRWPSIAARYKRGLLGAFRQGVAQRDDLVALRAGASKYHLNFTWWSGEQTVFSGTQIVFQVCSSQLSIAEKAPDTASDSLRKRLRDLLVESDHPVTIETVGWLRVHVDDLHRLVFIDEVQSDVMENLIEFQVSGDTVARQMAKELADWQLNGFSTVRHWASAIGYRVAIHSQASAAAIDGKSRSLRKWNLYYAALIKHFGLSLQSCSGYPAAIFVENDGGASGEASE